MTHHQLLVSASRHPLSFLNTYITTRLITPPTANRALQLTHYTTASLPVNLMKPVTAKPTRHYSFSACEFNETSHSKAYKTLQLLCL